MKFAVFIIEAGLDVSRLAKISLGIRQRGLLVLAEKGKLSFWVALSIHARCFNSIAHKILSIFLTSVGSRPNTSQARRKTSCGVSGSLVIQRLHRAANFSTRSLSRAEIVCSG